jgi:hypothetical protein
MILTMFGNNNDINDIREETDKTMYEVISTVFAIVFVIALFIKFLFF